MTGVCERNNAEFISIHLKKAKFQKYSTNNLIYPL